MRSRVTLAMMEAAAIDKQRASPLTMVRAGQPSCGRAVAVDGGELRRDGELRDGLRHRPQGGLQDVVAVDALHIRDADAEDRRRFDAGVENLARLLVEHFAVVDAVGDALGIEDHRGGDDRARERPAACLVDAGNGAAVELQLGSLQLERRHQARIGGSHGGEDLRRRLAAVKACVPPAAKNAVRKAAFVARRARAL